MYLYLTIGAGGAVGAVARFWLMSALDGLSQGRFPYGTLVVNISGSLLIGILYVLITEKMVLDQHMRALLVVGFAGAFTTFSTFSMDALLMLENGQGGQALLYILASVLLCIIGAWLGMVVTRLV